MPPEQPAAPQPAGVGGIAVKCQELQVPAAQGLGSRLPACGQAPAATSARRCMALFPCPRRAACAPRRSRHLTLAASPAQGLLAKLSTESARSSAALLAGHDDCARLQEHTALLSKQFSRTAMQARLRAWANWRRAFAHAADSQAVDEQREMLASSKSKMEAQHVALLAVGARLAWPRFRRWRRADVLRRQAA